MGKFPFVTLEAFSTLYPMDNHSSRVYEEVVLTYLPGVTIAASVADAYLQDVSSLPTYSASIADATLQVVTGSAILTLSGGTLTYTSVAIGASGDMTYTITNSGVVDLILSSLTSSGDFAITSITRN